MSEVLSKFAKENLDDDVFTGLNPLQEAAVKAYHLSDIDKYKSRRENKMATPNPKRLLMMGPAERRAYQDNYKTNWMNEEDSYQYEYPNAYPDALRQDYRMNDADARMYEYPIRDGEVQLGLYDSLQNGITNISNGMYRGINDGMGYIQPVMEPLSRGAGYLVKGLTLPYAHATEKNYR